MQGSWPSLGIWHLIFCFLHAKDLGLSEDAVGGIHQVLQRLTYASSDFTCDLRWLRRGRTRSSVGSEHRRDGTHTGKTSLPQTLLPGSISEWSSE
nr:hypothetical protein CFP56_41407 [Quercus suber]